MAKWRLQGLGAGIAIVMAAAPLAGARAGAFMVRDQTAAGFGVALAGVAAGGDLSYMFWNPAVLGDVHSFEVEGVATGVLPSINIDPLSPPGPSVGIGQPAAVPASFVAYPLTDRLTLGLAITSPFGLATEPPQNWVGDIYSRYSQIFSLNANPMVSYRLSDWLTVGAGLQIEYFRATLKQAISPLPGALSSSLKADGVGVGFNLGVQLKPWAGTTIGLGYRSTISHDLSGNLSIPGTTFPAKATLDTPDVVSLGLRQAITDRARLLGTVEWDHWSRLGNVPVLPSAGGPPLTILNLDYRDGWLFSVGGEYDLTDRMTLRAGVGYEISPLTVANRDTRLPETNQIIFSTGLTYRLTKSISLDFAYLFSHGLGNGDIDIGPGNPRFLGLPFHATSSMNVNIVSAAIDIKFDGLGRR